MRESRSYGSVRGASSNGRPYRDPSAINALPPWPNMVAVPADRRRPVHGRDQSGGMRYAFPPYAGTARSSLLGGQQRGQRAAGLFQLGRRPLIDQAAVLHDQDPVEGGGEAGPVQAPHQAALGELGL